MPDRPDVVVTGIGVVSPLGPLPVFWERLCRGEDGIAPIEAFDPGPGTPRTGARVCDWNPKDHIRTALLRRMDRLSQMVVTAARSALSDAALTLTPAEAEEAGIVLGTAYGNLAESEQFLRGLFAKGPALANPLTFPNLVLNAATGYVAIDLGLRGPNLTVCRGEASGEAAIALAYDTIVSGQADVLLAGGADEIAPVLFHVLKDLGALSPRDCAPRRRPLATRTDRRRAPARRRRPPRPGDGAAAGREWSSPFDRDRNGFVMGEGAALLVLERSERARARGARIYATLAGYATESVQASPHDWPRAAAGAAAETACQLADVLSTSAPARPGLAMGVAPGSQSRALPSTSAPARPGLGMSVTAMPEIDLVISCANSTRDLDAFEAVRLATLLGDSASRTLVTSLKGAIGDFGGAGAFSAAAAALALATGALPPLAALRAPDPACTLDLATGTRPARALRTVLISGSPRGGACVTLALRTAAR